MANIQKNNPNGYNGHKKNNQKLIIQPPIIDKEMIQQAFRDMWLARNNYQSKAQRFAYLNKKYLELDRIQEELEKEIEVKVR